MTHRIRSISVTIAMQNVLKKNKKPRSPDQNRPHLGYHSTFNQIWHKYLQASFAYIVSLPILFTSLSFPLGLSPPLFVLLCIVYAKDMSRVVVVATRIIIIVWWGVEIYTPLISNNSFARLIAMTAPHTERQRERERCHGVLADVKTTPYSAYPSSENLNKMTSTDQRVKALNSPTTFDSSMSVSSAAVSNFDQAQMPRICLEVVAIVPWYFLSIGSYFFLLALSLYIHI